MAEAILELEQVSRIYRSGGGDLTVLRNVSFKLERGATCAIVGPSGSGKTTLLGLCAGLDKPSSGAVRIAGVLLNNLTQDQLAALRNQRIGFVFQNFQLIPTLTALENVMAPLELRGGPSPKSEALGLLERVGLGKRVDHYPTQLSGGEQQRAALARAFVTEPEILFADEPTGNLDDENAHQVIELLFELNRAHGTALVLVTHNLELAARTQRIIQLRAGSMVEDRLTAGALR
jgi:putative ABC transport system ATP-binding protein